MTVRSEGAFSVTELRIYRGQKFEASAPSINPVIGAFVFIAPSAGAQ